MIFVHMKFLSRKRVMKKFMKISGRVLQAEKSTNVMVGWLLTMTLLIGIKLASVNVAVHILLREFAMFMGLSIKVEIWTMVGKR